MSRIKLTTFASQSGFNAISKVRKNTNGYLYVTMANTTTAAVENIYLGERFAATVKVDDVLDLKSMYVADTTNAGGEQRFKVTDRSGEISAAKLADYQTF